MEKQEWVICFGLSVSAPYASGRYYGPSPRFIRKAVGDEKERFISGCVPCNLKNATIFSQFRHAIDTCRLIWSLKEYREEKTLHSFTFWRNNNYVCVMTLGRALALSLAEQ